MVIANPMFDVVFMRVMENERAVRFIIGTLLDITVVSVNVQPQEYTRLVDGTEGIGMTVFRRDFIATIKTDEGDLINILIEIQKSRSDVDLVCFRNYVDEQYKRQNMVEGEKKALPIITIYILGYNLPELPLPFTEVRRQYRDGITKTQVSYNSNFVESLPHDSYVVQVERITGSYQTRIEKLLSIFEQTNFLDEERIIKDYKHPTDMEGIKIITDILHEMGSDPRELKDIQDEKEAWRTIYAQNAKERKALLKIIEEQDKVLAAMDKEIAEIDKEIAEIDKEIAEKDKEIARMDKEIARMDKEIARMDKEIAEIDKAKAEKDKELAEMDKEIVEIDKAIAEKDKTNAEMARQLEEFKRRFGEK